MNVDMHQYVLNIASSPGRLGGGGGGGGNSLHGIYRLRMRQISIRILISKSFATRSHSNAVHG